MTTFVGPTQVSVFQMVTIRSAIKLYAKTGMKANRAYTPTSMKVMVEKITGKIFKRGQWQEMQDALTVKIDEVRASAEFEEAK